MRNKLFILCLIASLFIGCSSAFASSVAVPSYDMGIMDNNRMILDNDRNYKQTKTHQQKKYAKKRLRHNNRVQNSTSSRNNNLLRPVEKNYQTK